MKEFTYRGHRCCYNEFRTEGNLQPMILIPDDGCPGYSVQSIISYIPSEYKIILVDFLGCGEADRPYGYVSDLWQDQAMQLKELFYTAGYEQAILIGFGEGGCRTAEAFLAEMPDRVERVLFTAKSYFAHSLPEELQCKVMTIPDSMQYPGENNWRTLGLGCRQILQGDDTRCPYCGGIMMRGLITGSRDLARWTIDDGLYAGGVPDFGEFYLRNQASKGFIEKFRNMFNEETSKKTAYVCYACGKLTADISNLI